MVTVFGTSEELNNVIRHYKPGHPDINFNSIQWNPMMFYLGGVFVKVYCREEVEDTGIRKSD